MRLETVMVVFGVQVMLSGCGKKEETVYSGEEGDVTVTRDAAGEPDKVTVTGKEGTATMEYGKTVLPEDLGISLYPGATAGQGGTMQFENQAEQGAGSVFSVSVHSNDAIDKVAQYYKEELKNQQPRVFEMAMPTGRMVTLTIEKDATVKTIVLSENGKQGGTDIQISRIRE
ncbi:hypothetical protein [Syntrophotalea acetylenica]|uniref:hypothetical protein n=1 Tax=Syntrophotalea acetylenica TaxID=29542 RepID=UPI002A36BD56|nr:hypothetical protein [Syntrophotalea acetylenica]MDY0262259.1 hypothetical protein [Syntrophotalea acetylenica]